MGSIPADYLPPSELRPQRIYTLPEFKEIPHRLNSTEELLDKIVAGGKADRVALYFEDKRIPYKALLAQVNKLGSALTKLGIEVADRVALRLPNIPPAIVANFAVLKIGGVILGRRSATRAENGQAHHCCWWGSGRDQEKGVPPLSGAARLGRAHVRPCATGSYGRVGPPLYLRNHGPAEGHGSFR